MGEKYLIPNTMLTIILSNCMTLRQMDEGTMGEKIPNTLYKRVTSRKTQKFATLLACNVYFIKRKRAGKSHFIL